MKNLIKIATVTMSLMLFSAMIISAQEHNYIKKTDKDSKDMMDTKKIEKNNDGVIYECPMKCEAATDMPGECSKCGMKLAKVSVGDSNKSVKCDSEKKGCCGDKEGMEKKNEGMEKKDHMNHKMENHSTHKNIDKNNDGIVYECPMKCEKATDKVGTCSKCGMNLKEVNVE